MGPYTKLAKSQKPPAERVLQLREEGLSYVEIGRRFGLPAATIRSWVHRKTKKEE